jgi:hypothetical protein
MTVYDNLRRADWLVVKRTFGDTELHVSYKDKVRRVFMPFHAYPQELWDKACATRLEMVAEWNAIRDVTKALMS